jgi:hypothetical protein
MQWLNFFLDEPNLPQSFTAISMPLFATMPPRQRLIGAVIFAFLGNAVMNSRQVYASDYIHISNLHFLVLVESELILFACLLGMVCFVVFPDDLLPSAWLIFIGMLVGADLAKICLIDIFSPVVIISCSVLPLVFIYFAVRGDKTPIPASAVRQDRQPLLSAT